MEKENNFKDTVNSLFKGMDGFVSAKTVVGDAIHVGDTISFLWSMYPSAWEPELLKGTRRTMAAEVLPERCLPVQCL